MLFTTCNSTYEVDRDGSRIRRLEGIANPTPRQGADGEWKDYMAISPIEIGAATIIIWRYVDGVAQLTHTSPVQRIIERVS